MAKEFNPIDKKALILYSLVLVVVIVVSAIIIKVPTKKTIPSTTSTQAPQTLTEVGLGSTEPSGYKIRGGWQVYRGVSFDVNYPKSFTVKASSSYDSVTFSSPDGITKLAVYAPVTPVSAPSEFSVNTATEKTIDSSSGKNPTCNILICTRTITVVEANNKSYRRKIVVSKNNTEKTTAAFSYQYKLDTPDSEVLDVFNFFQESLARHAK